MKVIKDSLTNIPADAVVNAANETLEGGGGVDFVIHQAAGIELLHECQKFPIKPLENSTVVDVGRCDVGEVIVTPSFGIKTSKFIFHTVAPILDNNGNPNEEMLKLCYRNCLLKMQEMKLKTIVFCCLGTGFYGFPKELAASIAVSTACEFPDLDVIFSVVEEQDYQFYKKYLKN